MPPGADHDQRPFLGLPYIGREFDAAVAGLNHVVRVAFSVRSLLDIFVATTASPFPTSTCGSGIYALACVCGALYVGRTQRSFADRIDEHRASLGSPNPVVMRRSGPGFHVLENAGGVHLFPFHHVVMSMMRRRNDRGPPFILSVQ
jgi:hypothetical protein